MTPGNGTVATATLGGERAHGGAGLREWALQRRASLLVFVAAAVIAAVRVLTWPSALREDQWVYTLSGKALVHLHRPIESAQYTPTTPKPLATLLAVVVSPLPPERGFAAVTIVATALLAAATFAYGHRLGGALGAVVAVCAFALLPSLPSALYGGEIDLFAAALVVLALVSGRRTRVALMILLGLIRPLAWPLAGVAAFLAAGGSLPRRLALGLLGAAAPVVIWLMNDAILYGSPLASYRANDRINRHVPGESVIGALDRVAHGVGHGTGRVLFVVGLAGLAVAVARRAWRVDPFPALLLAGYLAALVVTWTRMPYNARYALPVVTLWPLAVAHLVPRLHPRSRLRWAPVPAVGLTVAVLAAAAAHMSLGPDGVLRGRLTAQVSDAVPVVERALACGPVGITRPYTATELAVVTGHSIRDFRTSEAWVPLRIPAMRRNGWRRQKTAVGWLWVSPGCRAG